MIPRQESDHPIDKIRFGLMVAIGGEDSSETLELVKNQERIARREIDEVPKRAESRGPEFLEYSAASRTQLLTHLEEYLNWLTKAKDALESQNSSETVEAYEESQEILPKLNAALEAYSADFASFGPFQSAPANTLHRMTEGIATGELPKAAWREYCEYYQRGIEGRIEQLEQVQLPGRTLLRESYDRSADILQDLLEQEPPTPDAGLESLKPFDHAYHTAEKVENLMKEATQSGDTPIPATNALLKFFSHRDSFGSEALAGVVEDYGEIMDRYSENFEDAASRPTDSALVQEEIPRTLDNLDAHYAAIEELEDALEESDESKLEELFSRLKSTADLLEESREVYETAALHQTNIACPSCGRSNPPENRNCESCGEILPRPEDAGATQSSTFSILSGPALEENQQLEMTENVARLFQSCDDVNDGKITHEQFAAELQLASAGLKEFTEELDGLAATALDETNFTPEQMEYWQTTHLPYLEEVAVTFQAGIDETQEGLQTMEQYLADPNEIHLIEGIRITWQGLNTIHRARLSMETYDKMLSDVMEEAREEGLLTEG